MPFDLDVMKFPAKKDLDWADDVAETLIKRDEQGNLMHTPSNPAAIAAALRDIADKNYSRGKADGMRWLARYAESHLNNILTHTFQNIQSDAASEIMNMGNIQAHKIEMGE